MGALKIIGSSWLSPLLLLRKFLGAFVPIDHMNVRIKFEVRSFAHSWDNRGALKNNGQYNGQSLDMPTLPFPQNFKWALLRKEPVNVPVKFKVHSFTHCWDNRGYLKTLGSPLICPRSLFSKIFNGLLFGCTLWMYRPNLKSVALPVPGIIAGT